MGAITDHGTAASPAGIATLLYSVNLAALQGAFQLEDLWREARLLDRLIYKSKSQHRGTPHYKRLVEVRHMLSHMNRPSSNA